MLRLARVAAATIALAIRRLRHRRGIACASAAAIATAVGLLCAVGLAAARSGETARRAEVERWSPRARLVQMTVRRDERETAAQTLRDAERRFSPFARLLGRPASMVVAGPVSPADENGGIAQLDVERAAAWRRRAVGYLNQHTLLAGRLTALENVALAQALVGAPALLVVDEPTAHLDRANGRRVIGLLRGAAHGLGATVVASAHDPDLIEAADGVLDLGRQDLGISKISTV